jgi:hypothetical protein
MAQIKQHATNGSVAQIKQHATNGSDWKIELALDAHDGFKRM